MSTYLATTNIEITRGNLTCIRFPNGIQIEYGTIQLDENTTSEEFEYDKPFVATPRGSATWQYSYSQFGFATITCSLNSFRIDLRQIEGAKVIKSCEVIIFGRWK